MLRCRSVTACATESLPVAGAIYGISGTSAANVYAVGDGGHVVHFDGTSWTNMQSPASVRLLRVYAPAANDVFVFGDTSVFHYNGSVWENVTRAVFDQDSFGQIPTQSFQLGVWSAGPKELYIGTTNGMRRRGVFDWGSPQGPFDQGGRITAISGPAGGCGIAIADGTSGNGFGPILIRGVGPTGCNASPFTPPSSWP
jgi:hypothetical protein